MRKHKSDSTGDKFVEIVMYGILAQYNKKGGEGDLYKG